jgi:hypothetical protein
VENNAYEVPEIRDAFLRELANDWKAEVPPELITATRQVFDDRRLSSLFPGQQAERLEALRLRAAGSTFANNFLDCAIHADSTGPTGGEALRGAVASSVEERAHSRSRQMEEHYKRKATSECWANVRQRIAAALSACDFAALAAQLLGPRAPPSKADQPARTGLDDGPRL